MDEKANHCEGCLHHMGEPEPGTVHCGARAEGATIGHAVDPSATEGCPDRAEGGDADAVPAQDR